MIIDVMKQTLFKFTTRNVINYNLNLLETGMFLVRVWKMFSPVTFSICKDLGVS